MKSGGVSVYTFNRLLLGFSKYFCTIQMILLLQMYCLGTHRFLFFFLTEILGLSNRRMAVEQAAEEIFAEFGVFA